VIDCVSIDLKTQYRAMSFVAVLNLIKDSRLSYVQPEIFGDIKLSLIA
jgi:chromatin segregation and condensation protein Rec8/ScpA/Scc1 (kleisin family)